MKATKPFPNDSRGLSTFNDKIEICENRFVRTGWISECEVAKLYLARNFLWCNAYVTSINRGSRDIV
jgi:hypothetical protein